MDTKTPLRLFCVGYFLAMISCRSIPPSGSVDEGYQYPEQILTGEQSLKEVEDKHARIIEFLRRQGLGGILLDRNASVAWITAGNSPEADASLQDNVASVFIREDGKRFLIHRGSMSSSAKQDLQFLGFDVREVPWYGGQHDADPVGVLLQELSGGRYFGSESPFPGALSISKEIREMRTGLTPTEEEKYRWLGKRCAETVEFVCRRITPGMTERGIEALTAAELQRHSIRPLLLSALADGRVISGDPRYPAGTLKVEKYASIRVCASRWGLRVALSRSVHFGPVPDNLRREMNAVARVNAGFWARTEAGAAADAILRGAMEDYAAAGEPGAWRAQSQGGPIGYEIAERRVFPDSTFVLSPHQAFAWSPALGSVRIEETLLLLEDTIEIITATRDWPMLESKALGRIYRSPAILVR